MRRALTLTLATVLAMSLAPTATATATAATLSATPATIAGATLATTLPAPGAPLGVSPEVYFDDTTGTYYLFTTSMPPKEYSSPDGKTWTEVPGAVVPNGFDWSVVKEGPNNYRMYYAAINPNAPAQVQCTQMRKQLRLATSSDLVHWTTQPDVLLDDIGCGVPHVLKKTDGSYILYWNTITTGHGVHLATSPDGIHWTPAGGPLLNDQSLVDPAPIQLPDGTFLMVAASGGGPSQLQELRILSSADGLTWTQRQTPLYAPSNYSVFDPSLELINGDLRVWFSYASPNDMRRADARIAGGVLTLATASAPGATSAPVKAIKGKPCKKRGAVASGLVCKPAKGKLVWARR